MLHRRQFLTLVGAQGIGLLVPARPARARAANLTAGRVHHGMAAAQGTAGITLAGITLQDEVPIHPTPYFENTAKVVPPDAACPRGRIVVVTGQPRDTARILHRPLYAGTGEIDTTNATTEVAYPGTTTEDATGATKAIATDNQIVRLIDGSLLAIKDGYIWDDISPDPPAWFDETVTGSGDHKGQRAGVLVFRSTDCGERWALHATIDFATFLGGRYGVPRPMSDAGKIDVPPEEQGKHPDGSLRWWVGGPDRTEVYACPFTGLVYLTTRIVSGPYRFSEELNRRLDTLLLLWSRDSGKTWGLIKVNQNPDTQFPAWSPLVMTSTPNGRLFLFHAIGTQPTAYFSKAPVISHAAPEISPGHPVNYVEDGKPVANGIAPSLDLFLQLFHPTISRISVDTTSSITRAAYHSVNPDGMQEARIVRIEVKDPNRAPDVAPVQTIRADNPNDYSVVYFSFIDPDYIDTPPRVQSNTSVSYWIEAPRPGLSAPTYAIRYAVFEGDGSSSCSAYLSVRDGNPRTWSRRQDLGDYMTGGFFWYKGGLNYLAQWVEPTGIRANIVTIPYRPAPINSSLTLPVVRTSYNAADPRAPAGVFTITATFTNRGANDLTHVFFLVRTLTGGNELLKRDPCAPPGAGAKISVRGTALGPDVTLSPGESFTQRFEIGLRQRARFTFFVDAYGVDPSAVVLAATNRIPSRAPADRLAGPFLGNFAPDEGRAAASPTPAPTRQPGPGR